MIGLPRSTYYRRPRKGTEHASDADAELRAAITLVQREYPGYTDIGASPASCGLGRTAPITSACSA